ncbi:MAG: DUF6353 family protein [Candidatus Izemoplasmataceae bacterium]
MKNNLLKTFKPILAKYEPEILMTMGISGMLFATIWGVKATIKAQNIVDEKVQDLNKKWEEEITLGKKPNELLYKLTRKDILKLTWKLYVPVVVGTAVSIPCIVAGNRVSNKRNMALAAAYTLSETALQEYQDKTKEIIGDKKYEKIQESISSDKIQKTYAEGSKNITMIGDGESLFYEPLSGRYFKTNWNRISKAANELNANALGDMAGEITLGEWFDILGLGPTDLDNELGWSLANGKEGIIDISIDSVLTPDDVPCGSIRYNTLPKKI